MKRTIRSAVWLSLIFTVFTATVKAQQKNYNVAIFLYDKVELLDFAGPGEAIETVRGIGYRLRDDA